MKKTCCNFSSGLFTLPISKGEIVMKKKFVAPAVALSALVLALAACSPTNGGGNSGSSASSDTSSASSSSASSSSSSSSQEPAKIATGAQQYIDASYDERRTILGKLEKYAVDHALTGLPLYSDSSYVLYNPRVVKGTDTYIPGYGFSILRDGKLNGDLEGETNAAYQNYLHNWDASDCATANAWNAQDSQISDLFANMSTSLFGARLNSKKDGYEYYGVLAKQDKPYAVTDGVVDKTPDASELHQTWRIYVRTGEEGGVTYRTLSTKADRAKYDNRYVQLEDYLTPFKMMLNKANGLYRGRELATKTGQGAIVGASSYYNSTGGASTGVDDTVDFSGVGVKTGTDTDGDYIEVTYSIPVNRFYAMYYINDSMYEPLPAEFVNEVGITNLFGYNSDKSYSPVDNSLSVGPYTLESWETDKLITWKKNDNWFECKDDTSIYQIGGIHTDILTGYSSDKDIAIKEFLNSSTLDSAGVTSNYLAQYSTDPRAVKVPGSSTWKLNLNTCTEELWEDLFGENGSITHTQKENYWNVKPWMSNDNFIRGLFYSIDRENYAKSQGGTPCIDYFSDIYLSNPETGESYNSTDEHKAALEDFWGDTVETYGYSSALSEAAFEQAIKDLIADGSITTETASISIDIWWMYENQISTAGDVIGGYIKKSFDAAAQNLGYPVRLTVNNYAGAEWSDVYFEHLMLGQFDLGFGSISGNSLNPINFLEVLKSSNSSGFTLNWGADTTYIDQGDTALVYDNKIWSFDSLWDAADCGVILDNEGNPMKAVEVVVSSVTATADTVSIAGRLEIPNYDGLVVDLFDIYGTTDSTNYSDYFEIYPEGEWAGYADGVEDIVWDDDNNFSFTLTGTLAANVLEAGGLPVFGVDYSQTIKGVYGGTKSSTALVVVPDAA